MTKEQDISKIIIQIHSICYSFLFLKLIIKNFYSKIGLQLF